MSAIEGDRLSIVRATREVRASDSLRDFLKTARGLANDLEAPQGVPETVVFAAESLRAVLFERRAEASDAANEQIRKVHTRISSPKIAVSKSQRQPSGKKVTVTRSHANPLHSALQEVEKLYVPVDGPLLVRATLIAESTPDDYKHLGDELSLIMDEESSASLALLAQGELIEDEVRRTIAGRRLGRTATDWLLPTRIAFMRAHFAGDSERKDFIEMLSSELPVHDIEIDQRIEYGLKLVDPV